MKRETIITMSAISLVTLAAIGGLTFYSFAASPTGPTAYGIDKAAGAGRAFFGRRLGNKPLTTEQQAQIDARQADTQAEFAAIQKALKAGDYAAWVAAIKTINPNAPILGKINSDNFPKLVEANTDLENARTILKDLGIDGPGYGLGVGSGPGFGMMGRLGGAGGPGGMMGRWFR